MDAGDLDPKSLTSPQLRALAVSSPSAFYVTGEDGLQLSGWNITAGVRLRVSGRFMGLDGVLRAFVHDVALTTARVISSVVRSLGEGWILNLTVDTGATSAPCGSCFARVQVVRGLDSSGIVLGTLCAGYVTSAQPIAFPGGPVRSMVEGRGNFRSITGTDPAAGLEISETVPTGARWRFIALNASLVTDATVANRVASLVIDDGANVVVRAGAPFLHTASVTGTYCFGSFGASNATVGSQLAVTTPDLMILPAGYRVRTITLSIVAGDNWGAPQLLVEEFLDAQ